MNFLFLSAMYVSFPSGLFRPVETMAPSYIRAPLDVRGI